MVAAAVRSYDVRPLRWDWRTLLALSAAAALLGLLAFALVLPLAVTAVAITVLVLLLRPSTRAWLASDPEFAP